MNAEDHNMNAEDQSETTRIIYGFQLTTELFFKTAFSTIGY